MRKTTMQAIQKRLDQGLSEFAIGEKFYFVEKNHLFSQFRDDISGIHYTDGPMVEGVVISGIFDPDNIFTPEEKAALAARSKGE